MRLLHVPALFARVRRPPLRAREFNGFTLATIHNEHFFVKLLDDIRASIDGGYFDEFRDEALAHFYGNGERKPGL